MNLEQSFDINLMTRDIRGVGRRSLWQSKSFYLLVVALIVLSWTGVWGWYALRERDQKAQIASLQEKTNQAVVEQSIESQAEALRRTVAVKEAEVKQIEADLILCSEVLTQIETAVPPGTRLFEIAASDDHLICQGVAPDYPTLAAFISSINKRKNLTEARCVLAETTSLGVRFEVQLTIARD